MTYLWNNRSVVRGGLKKQRHGGERYRAALGSMDICNKQSFDVFLYQITDSDRQKAREYTTIGCQRGYQSDLTLIPRGGGGTGGW